MTSALRLPLACLGALLLWALPASAGTYNVVSCSPQGGSANHVWQLQARGKTAAYAACAPATLAEGRAWSFFGNQTGITLRNVSGSGTTGRGSSAAISARAPEGTLFQGFAAQYLSTATNGWKLGLYGDQGEQVFDFNCLPLSGSTTGCGSTKVYETPDEFDSENGEGPFLFGQNQTVQEGAPVGAPTVSLRLYCASSACRLDGRGAPPWTRSQGRINLYETVLTVIDYTLPQVGSVSGPLTDGPAQWHSGEVYAEASASDNVGLQSLSLQQDGEDLATLPATCDYTQLLPCGRQLSGRVTMDTTTLDDGEYQFDLAATDASNTEDANVGKASFTLRVDNQPPEAPEQPQQVNLDRESALVWNMPADTGSPIVRAFYSIGEEAGPGQPTPQLTNLRVPRTRADQTVWVWLEDALGHSSADNAVSFTVPSTATRARETQVGRPPVKRRPRPAQDPRPRPNLAFGRWSSRSVRTCVTWSDGQRRDRVALQLQVRRGRGAWRALRPQRPRGGCADVRLPRAYRRHGILQVAFPARDGLRGVSSAYRY